MTERKSMSDKVDALGAGLTDTVHDLIREAKPMLHHATDRMADRVSELTQHGLEAAYKGQRDIAHAGHDLTTHAEHMIRHEPFKAMLVAAGLGAAIAAVVGLMTRPHHPH